MARTSTRTRLLDAAAVLFARHGVRAVGVESILGASGAARATFYRHFRSKEDLVAAWLRSGHARWLDDVRAAASERASTPGEQLLAFFELLDEMVATPGFGGCPYLGTAAELREAGPEVRAAIVEYFAEVEAYFESLARGAGFPEPSDRASELRLVAAGAMSLALARDPSADWGRPATRAVLRLVAAAR